MKVFVKTLKGTHFEIEVQPEDSVADVKKHIETVHGADVYPAAQQMLIHQGKVLKDDSKLNENKVTENSFLVIMITKNKSSSGEASSQPAAPVTKNKSSSGVASSQPAAPVTKSKSSSGEASSQPAAPVTKAPQSSAPAPAPTPPATTPEAPAPVPAPLATTPEATIAPPVSVPATVPASSVTSLSESDAYGQAGSNLVAGSNLEQIVQQILDVGGGMWDRETVIRALRAAYNNPERAVEYLYSGIPENAQVPPVSRGPASVPVATTPSQSAQAEQPTPSPTVSPNADPLDLFPQGLPNMGSGGGAGALDFLRNSPQFQALRTMVQANPQILQPMLQELGKQNPHLMRLIQEHQPDFLRLINEPVEGGEGNVLGQLAAAMPQAITVTPEEREAIERLEAMGFDRATVLEVFFACNKNEQLAANYLLDHLHEYED